MNLEYIVGGISIMVFENYNTTDIYLVDPYHFGKILGESITQNRLQNEPIDIFITHQNNIRETLYPTPHQEF